jgi:hypothetical protein
MKRTSDFHEALEVRSVGKVYFQQSCDTYIFPSYMLQKLKGEIERATMWQLSGPRRAGSSTNNRICQFKEAELGLLRETMSSVVCAMC